MKRKRLQKLMEGKALRKKHERYFSSNLEDTQCMNKLDRYLLMGKTNKCLIKMNKYLGEMGT